MEKSYRRMRSTSLLGRAKSLWLPMVGTEGRFCLGACSYLPLQVLFLPATTAGFPLGLDTPKPQLCPSANYQAEGRVSSWPFGLWAYLWWFALLTHCAHPGTLWV